MPTVDPSAPTASRTFAGIPFTVPMPYAEGHALTAGEAAWLNSNLASVIGNAYSGDIRRAVASHNEAAKKAFIASGGKAKDYVEVGAEALGWDHAAKFAEKYTGYVLGESNRGTAGPTSTDTVGALARTLAVLELKRKLVKAGHKPGALMKTKNAEGVSKFNELLEALIARDGDHFRSQAEAQVADMDAGDPADDLFASLGGETETAAA